MAKGFGLCMASGSVTSMSDECFHSACLSMGGFPLVVQSCTHDSLSFTHSLSHSIPLLFSQAEGAFLCFTYGETAKKKRGGGVAFKSDMTKLQRCKCLTTGRWLDALQWSQKCVFSPHAPYCKVWWRLNHGSC